MTTDERYMNRCLELAKLGLRKAAPNPSVGCVIVHSGVIIGEGFTSPYGGNHAEVNAINSVDNKSLLGESTVYVSLEPCSHFGKTPPCADLLVHHKPKRVVIASLDPFAKVNGQGVKKLIENGIDVSIGVLEKKATFPSRVKYFWAWSTVPAISRQAMAIVIFFMLVCFIVVQKGI